MKKFKYLLLATAMVFMSASVVSAQDDTECMKYLSYYKEYYKQKSYNEAAPSWRKAYAICRPDIRETLYTEGAMIVRNLIKQNAKNPIYKQQLVDTLMTLHQRRMENFPKSRATSLNNMASDYIMYCSADNKVVFEKCSAIASELGSKTKPATLIATLKAAIELYKDGDLDTEVVLDTYDEYMGYIDQMEQTELVAKIKTDMEELFIQSKVAECDDLIRLFTPRFAEAKDDIQTVAKIVKMMASAGDCTDNNLFMEATTQMYKLDPNYSSAYYLSKLAASKGNVDAAIKYLEEAIAFPESDDAVDAQYLLELSQYALKNGRQKKAIECANAAVKKTSDKALIAKCYYVIGTAWGSLVCKGNEVEVRAHYWVAVDYLNKAKATDSSLAEDCNKLIKVYSGYFPNAADAFMYDVVDGKEFEVTTCEGVRATTVARTIK